MAGGQDGRRIREVLDALQGIKKLTGVAESVSGIFGACPVDERLNDHGYIVPGLGDAGDRIFGTLD